MSLLSRSVLGIGGLLLIHACYSANEHSSLLALTAARSSSSSTTAPSSGSPNNDSPYPSLTLPTDGSLTGSGASAFSALPLDITIETLLAVLILCIGIVLSANPLKPISWRVWAAGVERAALNGNNGDLAADGADAVGAATTPGYRGLEKGYRKGFLDIRAQRKEFADWVRGRGDEGNEKGN